MLSHVLPSMQTAEVWLAETSVLIHLPWVSETQTNALTPPVPPLREPMAQVFPAAQSPVVAQGATHAVRLSESAHMQAPDRQSDAELHGALSARLPATTHTRAPSLDTPHTFGVVQFALVHRSRPHRCRCRDRNADTGHRRHQTHSARHMRRRCCSGNGKCRCRSPHSRSRPRWTGAALGAVGPVPALTQISRAHRDADVVRVRTVAGFRLASEGDAPGPSAGAHTGRALLGRQAGCARRARHLTGAAGADLADVAPGGLCPLIARRAHRAPALLTAPTVVRTAGIGWLAGSTHGLGAAAAYKTGRPCDWPCRQ